MKRPEETPYLVIPAAYCSECLHDLQNDGDSWVCPHCGTAWHDLRDGATGMPYPEWSGEDYDDEDTPA